MPPPQETELLLLSCALNAHIPCQARRIRRAKNCIEYEMITKDGVAYEHWLAAVERVRDEDRLAKQKRKEKKGMIVKE